MREATGAVCSSPFDVNSTDTLSRNPGQWQKFASCLRTLPANSTAVYRLSNLLMPSPVDLAAVSEVVRDDVGLAAQVLKLANLDLNEPTSDLDLALVYVGLDSLRTLLFTVPILENRDPMYELWQHSAKCAKLCEWLARATGCHSVKECYVAGLLHDLGRIPLLAWVGDNVLDVGDLTSFVYTAPQAEDACLGINHQVVGGWLGVTWAFPDSLVEVLEHHHHPRTLSAAALERIVHAADVFCEFSAGKATFASLSGALNLVSARNFQPPLAEQMCNLFGGNGECSTSNPKS
ncbi:MAG TPA: HDOD domain-containing protein [Terriglobales bacterium]|nr:HDOD domain-containing protein [Terriglobales bacterium]